MKIKKLSVLMYSVLTLGLSGFSPANAQQVWSATSTISQILVRGEGLYIYIKGATPWGTGVTTCPNAEWIQFRGVRSIVSSMLIAAKTHALQVKFMGSCLNNDSNSRFFTASTISLE